MLPLESKDTVTSCLYDWAEQESKHLFGTLIARFSWEFVESCYGVPSFTKVRETLETIPEEVRSEFYAVQALVRGNNCLAALACSLTSQPAIMSLSPPVLMLSCLLDAVNGRIEVESAKEALYQPCSEADELRGVVAWVQACKTALRGMGVLHDLSAVCMAAFATILEEVSRHRVQRDCVQSSPLFSPPAAESQPHPWTCGISDGHSEPR